MSATPRAVLYLRSSKDRSDVSIDAQRRGLHELAQARGFVVVHEYADAVESGKDDDRPGFQALLRDLRATGRTWTHILALDTARIARRRVLAIIFEEQECRRAGVRIVYKSLPESDPITEMLLKSILQAMDEWHSLTSRVKGLAGMRENVAQGYRAGGRAPRGYRLATLETGAIRDGAPVTKSKLQPSDEALQVRAFLRARAQGTDRRAAMAAAGIDWPITTLIEIERNALTYAGATTWNRSAERQEDGYVGGAKWRPRAEWVIQEGTHEALISRDEAEQILARLEARKRGGGAPARRVYLLAGLLVSPTGEAWHGDAGAYRLGKGRRIVADRVEAAIVAQVLEDLASDDMAEAIVAHYKALTLARRHQKPQEEATRMRRRLAEIDRQIDRLASLIAETTAPAALLRSIEKLESEREASATALASLEADQRTQETLRAMTKSDVRALLRRAAADLHQADPEMLRKALPGLVQRVELDPESFRASVAYCVDPVRKTGDLLASPRAIVQFPSFVIPHNRRQAGQAG